VKVKHTQCLFCLLPICILKAVSNTNAAIGTESEERIGVVSARFNNFADVKCASMVIFVATTGIFLITRPIKITPLKRQVLKVMFASEMFDVLPEYIEWSLTIGATTTLHLLQLFANLNSVAMV
jgi:hypothetical protein